MIIILRKNATEENIQAITQHLESHGYGAHLSRGVECTIVGAIGSPESLEMAEHFESLPYVERVIPILKPYKLVSREAHPENSEIPVGPVTIGGLQAVVMAGPCTVESWDQLMTTAWAVKEAGATILRGGAFKPSTSPYSFHGLGEEGLQMLAAARSETGLPVITEVMDTRDVEMVARYADILQIGTRNMANFSLLKAVGQVNKPVMLKRGWASKIEEWLQAAEYIALEGNQEIILCERGIRTFETYTRNTVDINAIPAVKELSHLPVILDPSQGTGKAALVGPVSRAGIAAGADGLIIEVHPNPAEAIKDGPQSLTIETFRQLMAELPPIARAVGRTI
ncbi:MAG: 3-deoxy-7-phosphoheptulonate synthase [Armatimonadetes bacterium]|nr:3-deoxy-7-phosphoheptulonate synthase [Armatimonadota bacterium]